jgi:hypothetical protein
MYDVMIKSDYQGFFVDGGNRVFGPGTYPFPHWSGTHIVNIPAMGDINLIDLANKKLDRYTNDSIPWTKYTLGGLIRYRGLEAYFRYEGQGYVEIGIDNLGSINLTFPQGGMLIKLDDMTVTRN